jgi:hypothetical protein
MGAVILIGGEVNAEIAHAADQPIVQKRGVRAMKASILEIGEHSRRSIGTQGAFFRRPYSLIRTGKCHELCWRVVGWELK